MSPPCPDQIRRCLKQEGSRREKDLEYKILYFKDIFYEVLFCFFSFVLEIDLSILNKASGFIQGICYEIAYFDVDLNPAVDEWLFKLITL